jgi:hypothetical protein
MRNTSLVAKCLHVGPENLPAQMVRLVGLVLAARQP